MAWIIGQRATCGFRVGNTQRTGVIRHSPYIACTSPEAAVVLP